MLLCKMVTIQHIMYLIARTVHHHVNYAEVGNKLVTALFVADVIVATHELEIDAHLAESIFVVILRSGDRVDIVGNAEMFASSTDLISVLMPKYSATAFSCLTR